MKSLAALGLPLLITFAITPPAHAWWDTGHMITTQIAYDRLTPAVKKEVDRLSLALKDAEPSISHVVPASVWMDDIKPLGLKAFDKWHYINVPYNPIGLPNPPAAKEENVVWSIEQAVKTFKNKEAKTFQKAFMLRVLTHMVGDVHQPFHAVGKVSHEHHDGDQGGNLTKIGGVSQDNIHAFWDSTANRFPSVRTPQWNDQQTQGWAKEVVSAYPAEKMTESLAYNPQAWSEESYQLATRVGYETLPGNGKLTPEYIKQAQEICVRRLAVGGYRLAALLNDLLK